MFITIFYAFKKTRGILNEQYDLDNPFCFPVLDTSKIDCFVDVVKEFEDGTAILESITTKTFKEAAYEWALNDIKTGFGDNENILRLINNIIKQLQDYYGFSEVDKEFFRYVTNNKYKQGKAPISFRVERKDGKIVTIYNKYWQNYGYPPRYLYDDIQNHKKEIEFYQTPMTPDTGFDQNRIGKNKLLNICSAVLIQPSDDRMDVENMNFACVNHYRRGFELVSERGCIGDKTFTDIAIRTITKELNIDPVDCSKLILKGVIICDKFENSFIYLFTIINWSFALKKIPKEIEDKNIDRFAMCGFKTLTDWSQWHINKYYEFTQFLH
ncbi:hypothetical protein BJ944DRAFT_261460 [Cunninghamella echinulata]|nr:hypothetical protein BJ944DRAFT_261460 [Cunninghamella echinulata]